MENQNNIRVIRYVRPTPYNCLMYHMVNRSNLYGITMVFDIDYDTRKVVARWSVCTNDNFEKKIGVERALLCKKMVTFNLDEVVGGLVNTLFHKITGYYNSHISEEFYEDIRDDFVKALR